MTTQKGMQAFVNVLKKYHENTFCELECEQKRHIKHGFLITKFLWYAVRFYAAFPLYVEVGSPLYKAMEQSRKILPGVYYYFSLEGKIVLDQIFCVQKTDHWSLDDARNTVEQLKSKVRSQNAFRCLPKTWKYFRQFCSQEPKDLLKSLFERRFPKQSALTFPTFDFNRNKWKEVWNQSPFPGDSHIRCQDSLAFCFHGILFVVVYHRTFYFKTETDVSASSESCANGAFTISVMFGKERNYRYLEEFQLYGFSSQNLPLLLVKSKYLNLNAIGSIFQRNLLLNISPSVAIEVFSRSIVSDRLDWNRLDSRAFQTLFQIGSVLRVKRSPIHYHAAVYLGEDNVIHIHTDKKLINKSHTIFVYDKIWNFIGNDTEVQEIRFLIPKYNKKQLFARAVKMSKMSSVYHLADNNCEHLAFFLATGKKFSLQVEEPLANLIAQFVDEGIKACVSLSNVASYVHQRLLEDWKSLLDQTEKMVKVSSLSL